MGRLFLLARVDARAGLYCLPRRRLRGSPLNAAAARFPALIVARLIGFFPYAMLEPIASEADRQRGRTPAGDGAF